MKPTFDRRPVVVVAAVAALFPLVASMVPGEETEGEERVVKGRPTLSLTLSVEEGGFQRGDEIPIVFTIVNEGKQVYSYMDRNYDRSGRMPEYRLAAVDGKGEAVPDPRDPQSVFVGGGLSTTGELAPGESFTKTIALNRWALVKAAGSYQVTGTYAVEGAPPGETWTIDSPPIRIEVRPRSDEALGRHIEALSARLGKAEDGQDRAALVRRLMYTVDGRAAPALVDAFYREDSATFWAAEAFNHYLPQNAKIDGILLSAAEERGLANNMYWTLQRREIDPVRLKRVIEVSLSPDHPSSWAPGALAAQQFGEDRFVPRLVAIAMDPGSEGRIQAIYALALHRTDESVAVLKKLLVDADPKIRERTENAIRTGYLMRGNSRGRQMNPDDFPAKYQKQEVEDE